MPKGATLKEPQTGAIFSHLFYDMTIIAIKKSSINKAI